MHQRLSEQARDTGHSQAEAWCPRKEGRACVFPSCSESRKSQSLGGGGGAAEPGQSSVPTSRAGRTQTPQAAAAPPSLLWWETKRPPGSHCAGSLSQGWDPAGDQARARTSRSSSPHLGPAIRDPSKPPTCLLARLPRGPPGLAKLGRNSPSRGQTPQLRAGQTPDTWVPSTDPTLPLQQLVIERPLSWAELGLSRL
ncbi:hypothetical protein KIL84_005518 [Mauremys mutica]|uniref:Uncharacterized protein n=1 Tax=Mauremys mutica TaxID=74926 RepID=A0A9D3XKU8_9SAUR|nr:hypothetical protein KIL84_005518 [Mauremys mutica]